MTTDSNYSDGPTSDVSAFVSPGNGDVSHGMSKVAEGLPSGKMLESGNRYIEGDMRVTLREAALAGKRYQIFYADPAWDFSGNSKKNPGRNARRHYPCMSVDEIAALPVKPLVEREAVLFLWITSPFLVIGAHIKVMKAWGFTPTAMGFTWIKTKPGRNSMFGFLPEDLHMGTGHTTRKNAEFCIIGKRGRSLRHSAAVHEVGVFPVMEHSRKPEGFRERIEQYVGADLKDYAKAELFGRRPVAGWDVYGNQNRGA